MSEVNEVSIHKKKLWALNETKGSNEERAYVQGVLSALKFSYLHPLCLKVLSTWGTKEDSELILTWFEETLPNTEIKISQVQLVEPLRMLARYGHEDWLIDQYINNIRLRKNLGFVFRTLQNQKEIALKLIESKDPFLRKSAIEEIMFSYSTYKDILEDRGEHDVESSVRFAARYRLNFLKENQKHFP